jgi:hypothetical protein
MATGFFRSSFKKLCTWFVLLAFVGMMIVCCRQNRGSTNIMNKTEIQLDFKILSTPVIWGGKSWSIAVVGGKEQEDGDKSTAVYAYGANGKLVSGFPVLQRTPFLIPPASQIGVADFKGDGIAQLVVVDIDGRILTFDSGRISSDADLTARPIHSLQTWPPSRVKTGDVSADRILLVSRDFKPKANSQNGVDLVNAKGISLPGYPQALSGTPELHPPLMDMPAKRFYVMLQTGEVDGFDLISGRRLSGFPSSPLVSDTPDYGYRAVLCQAWKSIMVAYGGNSLWRIDLNNGRATHLNLPKIQRVTGITMRDNNLYVLEEASGELYKLDGNGGIRSRLLLGLSPTSRNYYFTAADQPGSKNNYIVIASTSSDNPDAKIASVFEQYATAEIKKKINQLAEDESIRRFNTLQLNLVQRKEIAHSIQMMQRGYLQTTLGFDKTDALLAGEAVTRIQVAVDENNNMRLLLDDAIKGYTPETGFSYSDMIFPVTQSDSTGVNIIIPLNGERKKDPLDEYRSLIRIYRLFQ